MTRARWLVSTVIALAPVQLTPTPARACSYAPVSASLLGARVPTEGPLLVEVSCVGSGEELCATGSVELTVLAAGAPPDAGTGAPTSGMPVPGNVQTLRTPGKAYLAWLPDAPLEAGRAYRAVTDTNEMPFEAVAASELSFTELALDALTPTLVTTWTPVGDEYCCGGGLACFPSCYTEQEQLVGDFGVTWTAVAPDVIVRTRFVDAGGQEHESGWVPAQNGTRVRLSHATETYCVTVEVGSVFDDSIDSRELCVDGSELNVGARRARTLGPEHFDNDCESPPGTTCDETGCEYRAPALRDAWCAAKADLCDGSDESYTCTELGQHCESEPLAPESRQGEDATENGCSCRMHRRDGERAPLVLLMAALVGTTRRPRSRRPPAPRRRPAPTR